MSKPNKALLLSLIPKIQEILSEPGRWTKGAMGKDATGKEIALASPSACSWCIYGAIAKVCGPSGGVGEAEVFSFLSGDLGVVAYIPPRLSLEEREMYAKAGIGSLVDYNDAPERTHADILALLERGLARAKALPDEPVVSVPAPPAPPQETSWVHVPV